MTAHIAAAPAEREKSGSTYGRSSVRKARSSTPPRASAKRNAVRHTALPMRTTLSRLLPMPISLPTMTAAALAMP